jgi:membrane-associated phospholipid phosphatase
MITSFNKLLILPLIFLALALWIWLTNNNTNIFLILNTQPLIFSKASHQIFWSNMTLLGDTLVIISILALFIKHHFDWIIAVLVGGTITALFVHFFKWFTDIDRPYAVLKQTLFLVNNPPIHYSFPSGHTASIFLLVAIIFFSIKNKIINSLLLIIALIIGFSRIMVAAHWPIDVLVGASFGWFGAYLGLILSRKIQPNKISKIMIHLFILLVSIMLFFHHSGYDDVEILQKTIALSMGLLTIYIFLTK